MAREINRLTKKDIKGYLKEGKQGRWCDGNGLYFQVSKWGTGSWIYRYMIDGRPRHMGLGSFNEFPTLAKARKRGEKVRQMIKGDDDPTKPPIDPIEAKREARDKSRAEAREQMTFREALARYVEVHRTRWTNPKYAKQAWATTLKTYARPLFDRPVSAIDRALITETLAPFWKDKAPTAARVKQRIEAVTKWVRDGMPLPSTDKKTRKHLPSLEYEKVPAFIAELRKLETPDAKALEFAVLTGARSEEVLDAKWSEMKQYKRGIWVCPGVRLDAEGARDSGMKSGKEHRFALCDRAIEILDSQPRIAGSDYVFPRDRKPRLGHNAMLDLTKKLHPGVTAHGFRSSMRTWAEEESSFPIEVCRAQQWSAIKDQVARAYERGDGFRKRHALVQAWQRFVDGHVDQVAQHRKSAA
jgi:integrase